MFTEPTTFILGAGASWHYGYPTGEELVKRVISMADIIGNYLNHFASINDEIKHAGVQQKQKHLKAIPEFVLKFNNLRSGGQIDSKYIRDAGERCHTLKERLKSVNPIVIDYFLGHNEDLQDLGKLIISAVLNECEVLERDFNDQGNQNRRFLYKNSPHFEDQQKASGIDCTKYKDDWVRFLVHQMTMGIKKSEQLLDNQVTFITFNYDISLERRLYKSLSAIKLFEGKDIEAFINERVHHVYGKLRESFVLEDDTVRWLSRSDFKNDDFEWQKNQKRFLDQAYQESLGIRTIGPSEKEEDIKNLDECKKSIYNCRKLYILGYGFDPENNSRLKLSESFPQDAYKKVYFTNYGGSNKINKIASELMLRSIYTSEYFQTRYSKTDDDYIDYFIERSIFNKHSTSDRCPYIEKSISDVYTALESDFDS